MLSSDDSQACPRILIFYLILQAAGTRLADKSSEKPISIELSIDPVQQPPENHSGATEPTQPKQAIPYRSILSNAKAVHNKVYAHITRFVVGLGLNWFGLSLVV